MRCHGIFAGTGAARPAVSSDPCQACSALQPAGKRIHVQHEVQMLSAPLLAEQAWFGNSPAPKSLRVQMCFGERSGAQGWRRS